MRMSGPVSLAEAVNIFSSLPADQQIPSLHPDYVKADSLRDCRLRPIFWFYSDFSFKCLRSFHIVISTLKNGQVVKDIESAYGYGGVVCSSQDSLMRAKAHKKFCAWAQQESVMVEFCRIHPLLAHQRDFFSGQRRNREVIWIDLASDFRSSYRKKRRWTIKKELQKDIRLKCAKTESDISLFRALYEETMRRAGAGKFYFFNDQYFEHLLRLDCAKLWFVFYEDQPLSAAIILENANSGIAEYHLGAYAISSGNQPMEILLHLIAEHYSHQGFKYFYLGGGRSTSGDDSLLAFKKGFSKNMLSFSLGFNIFNQTEYDNLHLATQSFGESARVIFYRD
jgi:serine/alanine adding enzyme